MAKVYKVIEWFLGFDLFVMPNNLEIMQNMNVVKKVINLICL